MKKYYHNKKKYYHNKIESAVLEVIAVEENNDWDFYFHRRDLSKWIKSNKNNSIEIEWRPKYIKHALNGKEITEREAKRILFMSSL